MNKQQHMLLALVVVLSVVGGCDSSTGVPNGLVYEERLHTRPAWSPDGQTIAFRNERSDSLGLYLVDTSGANFRLLYPGDAIGFTWSPDNAWLAFSELGSLYKIHVNGDSLTVLPPIPNSIRPAWSPDGQRIAFVRGTTFVLNLQNNLEEDMQFAGNYPSWFSDSMLVVLELIPYNNGLGGIYNFKFLNINTRVTQTIHSFSSDDDCAFSSINSAGTEIIYGAKPPSDYTQIRKVSLATEQHISLTTGDAGDYPAWSPDGSKIVYTRTVEGDGGLWIMNADGSGKRRLTTP